MPLLSVEPNAEVTFKTRYQDEHLAVVDKRSGLATQPGLGHERDTLLNGLFAAHGTLRSLPRSAPRPSASTTRAAIRPESARVVTWCAAPLCKITRENRPRAGSAQSNVAALIAPALCAITVTRSGSPPNAATWARTKRSASS